MQLFMPRVASSAPDPDGWAMSMIRDCIKILTAETPEEFCISGQEPVTFPTEYDRCVTELNVRLAAAGPGSVAAWVLLDTPPRRSALASDCDYQAIIQLLILTFPDIRWVTLPTDLAKAAETGELCAALLAGLVIHQLREETLLDCHGLQDAIRETINQDPQLNLPQRSQLAVAIDEEESYAYFNAYAAYRFGKVRAAVVSTEALLETRLRQVTDDFKPSLVIEDLYLSFPDREAATEWHGQHGKEAHMSNLRKRDDYFQVMKTAGTRVFVTVGHAQAGMGIVDNRPYLQQLEDTGRRIVGLHKPVSGLFRFWFEATERKPPRQIWKEMAFWATVRAEAADALSQFRSLWLGWRRWRLMSEPEETINKEGPHSAPGRLLLVATRLITRAESLLGQVASVRDAVRGAVLSTQASELLGGRTPTTAFEALSLKHAFEVLAECQFQGVEGVIDMNERFEEIREEANNIGRWFEPKRGKQSVLNAQLKIAGRLALILRDKNLFDEEQRCLSETRDLYQQLWFARRPRILMLFKPIIVYLNWLLSSVRVFAECIVGWIFILALLYFIFDPNGISKSNLSGPEMIVKAFETFFSLQKTDPKVDLSWVDALAIVLGVAHLGVFISHLYSSSARR